MSEAFIGQIFMFGGNFAPRGWAFCAGQTLAISQNEALFALIGTTYGGDGQTTFNLPDLRGRVPVHVGQGPGLSSYQLGQAAGAEVVTLTTQQIPGHSHAVNVVEAPANNAAPGGNVLATEVIGLPPANCFTYGAFGGTQSTLAPATIGPAGGSQPHENRQPFLTLNYVIALEGIFPTQG